MFFLLKCIFFGLFFWQSFVAFAEDVSLEKVAAADDGYLISDPIRYKSVEEINDPETGYKTNPFYKDYIAKVIEVKEQEDDKGLPKDEKVKSSDALVHSMNTCIFNELSKRFHMQSKTPAVSLQAATTGCHLQEIYQEVYGASSQLYTLIQTPTYERLRIRVQVPEFLEDSLKAKPVAEESLRHQTCLENPNQLDCFNAICVPIDTRREEQFYPTQQSWTNINCGKDFCAQHGKPGAAFMYRILTEGGAYETGLKNPMYLKILAEYNMSLLARRNSSQMDDVQKILEESMPSPDHCFTCPTNSKLNEFGTDCLDLVDGCSVFTQIFSPTRQRCVRAAGSQDQTCSYLCNREVENIQGFMQELETGDSCFKGYSAFCVYKKNLTAEKIPEFMKEMRLTAEQTQQRYQAKMTNCQEDEINVCLDFSNDVIRIRNKYLNPSYCSSENAVTNYDCDTVKCRRCFEVNEYLENLKYGYEDRSYFKTEVDRLCGASITNNIIDQLINDNINSNIAEELKCMKNQPYECVSNISAEQIQLYAQRARFECTRPAGFTK